MGSGMAGNLLKAGYGLVIHDLRREVTRPLEERGAKVKESPRGVAEASEVVLSMLPYNEAVEQVGLGEGGLHEAVGGARLWVDSSSIDRKTILGLNRELAKKGWQILDASAGGVEEHAAAGTLSLWVSGSKKIFDQHLQIFKAMGKNILHVGEMGNAKLVKNAVAMLAAIEHLGLVEILNWLKKGGVSEQTFQQVISQSQLNSEAFGRMFGALISGKFKPRKSWMPKDVGFGLDMARQMGVPVPFSSLPTSSFQSPRPMVWTVLKPPASRPMSMHISPAKLKDYS